MVSEAKMTEIKELLSNLEKEKNITILFAVESGSRAWGFASEDSDYDIRFIYKHNDLKWYISVNERDEQIDGFTNDRTLDWCGWDIKKALKYLRQSNPAMIEWLYSGVIYHDNGQFAKVCREAINQMHGSLSLMYHYRNMATSNFKQHIKENDKPRCKKYLYVIRPVAMLLYIMNNDQKSISNMNFCIDLHSVLDMVRDTIDPEIIKNIYEVIANKQSSESNEGTRYPLIDDWINDIIADFDDKYSNKKDSSKNMKPYKSCMKDVKECVKKYKDKVITEGDVYTICDKLDNLCENECVRIDNHVDGILDNCINKIDMCIKRNQPKVDEECREYADLKLAHKKEMYANSMKKMPDDYFDKILHGFLM